MAWGGFGYSPDYVESPAPGSDGRVRVNDQLADRVGESTSHHAGKGSSKEHCQKCGAQVGAGDNFCSSCGDSLVNARKQRAANMHRCGAARQPGAIYCYVCGERV